MIDFEHSIWAKCSEYKGRIQSFNCCILGQLVKLLEALGGSGRQISVRTIGLHAGFVASHPTLQPRSTMYEDLGHLVCTH